MTSPSTTARPHDRGRYIEVRSGRRVHVIEAGEGPPVVLLHGTSTSSLSLLPVLERLEGALREEAVIEIVIDEEHREHQSTFRLRGISSPTSRATCNCSCLFSA